MIFDTNNIKENNHALSGNIFVKLESMVKNVKPIVNPTFIRIIKI